MVRITRATRKKLGEILMEADLLTPEQVARVIKEQKETGELFGDILLRLGLVSEQDIALALVTQFRLPFIFLRNVDVNPDLHGIFPEAVLRKYQFVPFDKIGNILLVASAGVFNSDVLEELEGVSGCMLSVYIATISEIKNTIDEHFKDETSFSEMGELLGLGGL